MLKVTVSGKAQELHPFIHDLTQQPQYAVELCSTETAENLQQEISVQALLQFHPLHRKPLFVQLHAENGENIVIHFLDSTHVQLNPSVTYISGKVYDIFG